MNGKVVHAYRSEEQLKCPYYPKQSTASMQFLLKITMAFFTEIKQS